MGRRARVTMVALGAAALATTVACRRPAPGPNVIFITVDTLRADHLGVAGYGRDTSPTIDALAREGVWFPRCYTQSATTGASHASIFTAVLPPTHGVLSNHEQFPDRPSLFRTLRERGWVTAGFVSSVVVGRKFGVQHALDHFDDEATSVESNRPERGERVAADTLAAAGDWLAARADARPFFAWIHLIDPHGPYTAPLEPDRYVNDDKARFGARALAAGDSSWVFDAIPAYQLLGTARDPEYYVARYDAEIRYADDALGAFFARVRALGLWDRTLVVLTADHGETLADPDHHRYFSHGVIAYEEVSRVPLVIREPGGRDQLARVDATRPVMAIDVAPTVLDLVGLEAPSAFEGRSLLAGPRDEETPLVSLGAYGRDELEKRIGTQFSVRRGPWRYIMNSRDGSEELYDHRVDPAERRNVAATTAATRDELRATLGGVLAARAGAARPVDITPEHREKLRALGYVE
ncbi:MAG: sulfatase [Deltaproteobacteria bacterium]|nr:sulfatase [Deltaproteobacteria bacterium]